MGQRRFNHAQQVVTLIAFGFVLYFLGSWLVSLGTHLPYGSATFTRVSYSNVVGRMHPWAQFTTWMILIATWGAVTSRVLRDRMVSQEGRWLSE
jgi:hypothetical protein